MQRKQLKKEEKKDECKDKVVSMECYVCYSGDGKLLKNTCNCIDRVLHERCLRRLISEVESHANGMCPICASSYQGLSIRRVRVVNWSLGTNLCTILTFFTVLFVLGLKFMWWYTESICHNVRNSQQTQHDMCIRLLEPSTVILFGCMVIIPFFGMVKHAYMIIVFACQRRFVRHSREIIFTPQQRLS